MSKGNVTENDFMKIVFTKTYDPAWRGQDNLYLALHYADPAEDGVQTSNEVAYSNYGRATVTKDAAGWTITDNQAVNAALIQFNQCQGATGATLAYISIGTCVTLASAGQILYSGALNSPLIISNLIQPQFQAGALVIEED